MSIGHLRERGEPVVQPATEIVDLGIFFVHMGFVCGEGVMERAKTGDNTEESGVLALEAQHALHQKVLRLPD